MEEMMHVLESTLNIDFIRGTISGPRKKRGNNKGKNTTAGKKRKAVFSAGSAHENTGLSRKSQPGRSKKTYRVVHGRIPADTDRDGLGRCDNTDEQERKKFGQEEEKAGKYAEGGSFT